MVNSLYKTLAISLMTLIVGAFGTWVSLGMDKVSRTEVQEMIKQEAPSPTSIEALRSEIVELKIEQAKMNEKLELLLKKEGVR